MAAPSLSRIAVLGAGAWGTALAVTARRAGCTVTLWARSPAAAAGIEATRENARRLPGIRLEPEIAVTADMDAARAGADAVLMVVPMAAVRVTAASLAGALRPGVPVAMCAKGIEPVTGLFPAEIVAGLLPEAAVAVLSGPTFAAEVAAGKPTAVTLACREEAIAT
ncbi:MAG: glycerol-3-phosphate acyltransferase, partial [Alphaproteobacteria bacterium]|nr:glycerol-3-phosphate acyltransferase [Alphaproteobacteria bacterium]